MGDSPCSLLPTVSPSEKRVQIEHALTAVGSGQTSLGIKDETAVQKAQSLTPNTGVVYSDEKIISQGTTSTHGYGSDDYWDDPFLEDGLGNLTQSKLSDLSKTFDKNLVDKMNEPEIKEKKQSKLKRLKLYNDRFERYKKAALNKCNSEENLDEDLRFQFVKGVKESYIIEGLCKMYRHFNFEAMRPSTSVSLFFAEVIPHKEDVRVTCCMLLGDNDNATCFGCNNQGLPDLKYPASDNYIGGHVDCEFPFLVDSDSEDDSD